MGRKRHVLGTLLASGLIALTGVAAAGALVTRTDIPRAALPVHSLTPGASHAISKAKLCNGTVSSHTNAATIAQVFARYGLRPAARTYEIDHLISVGLGGSETLANLWPQPLAGTWGARAKNRLEARLHAMVCDDEISLTEARHALQVDWTAGYRAYMAIPAQPSTASPITTPAAIVASPVTTAPVVTTAPAVAAPPATQPVTTAPAVPVTPTPGPGDPVDAGGFYASSYPTATTIYCGDDPDWRTLSTTYLRHFGTWAEAIATYPGRHLHQPC